MEDQGVSGLQRSGYRFGFIGLHFDGNVVGLVFNAVPIIRLAGFVTSGDDAQAAVFLIGVVQRGEAGNGGIGIEFSVGVVVMPAEGLGVAAELEGELAGGGLDVRTDELLSDIRERAGEVVAANQFGMVVDVDEQRILKPGPVRIERAFDFVPGGHAFLTHELQSSFGQYGADDHKTLIVKLDELALIQRLWKEPFSQIVRWRMTHGVSSGLA